jgi:hypothetical protein
MIGCKRPGDKCSSDTALSTINAVAWRSETQSAGPSYAHTDVEEPHGWHQGLKPEVRLHARVMGALRKVLLKMKTMRASKST